MKAISRRIEKLEVRNQPNEPSAPDPVSGEFVSLYEIVTYATDEELYLSELCLNPDVTKVIQSYRGCEDPRLGFGICAATDERRQEVFEILQRRWFDRRAKRRPPFDAERGVIEEDGLEWLVLAAQATSSS